MGCASSSTVDPGRVLVLYDFDLSMMNETSDTWIVDRLHKQISQEFQSRLDAGFVCWTDIIDDVFGKLHEAGISQQDIVEAMQQFPHFEENVQVIGELGEAGVCQKVVSDANTVYIRTFLEHHELLNYFSDIYSNPSHFDASGRLHIARFLPKEDAHSCQWCDDAPNMCKGIIFDKILDECGDQFDRILFVCDGSNDYCGCLHLRESDTALCRRDLGLTKRLDKYGKDSIPCGVEFWSDGAELRTLIHKYVTGLESAVMEESEDKLLIE